MAKAKRVVAPVVLSPTPKLLIPTGSTCLNLALSDCPDGGYGPGKIVNVIGDASAGKTLAQLTMLAELANDSRFKDYVLIYDDAEEASEFDLVHLFGEAAANRIKSPATVEGNPTNSETIEDFQQNINVALDNGSFIYILDSLDAVTSEEEQDHLEKVMKARREGKPTKGSYDLSKPRTLSRILRMINSQIKETNSLLIVISQTRDNISPISFVPKVRSGGRALEFYSSYVMWLAVEAKITKTYKGKPRTIGTSTKAKVSKNKVTGKMNRYATFPLLYDYGLDDIGSMIDFMISEGGWSKTGRGINSTLFKDEPLGRETMIEAIESGNKEKELQLCCGELWTEIEDAIKTNRKRKF